MSRLYTKPTNSGKSGSILFEQNPQWRNVSNLVSNVDFLWLYKFEQRWKLDLKQGSCQALEGAMMEVRSSVQSAFSLQSCQCARAGNNKLEIVNKIATKILTKEIYWKIWPRIAPFHHASLFPFFPKDYICLNLSLCNVAMSARLTFRFRNFSVSKLLPNLWGFRFRKIWFRKKKSQFRFRKNLVSEKSLGLGFGKFGLRK